MNRNLLLAALLLPFVVLGVGIFRHQAALADAEIWRIPISGYDPRDPLRGQFIQFSYDWHLKGDASVCETLAGCDLCLARDGGVIIAEIHPAGAICKARVDIRASRISVQPSFRGMQPARFSSRIFVSETSAPALEKQLQSGPMVAVAAIAPDGRLINRSIQPARR